MNLPAGVRAGEPGGAVGGRVTDRGGHAPVVSVRVTLAAQSGPSGSSALRASLSSSAGSADSSPEVPRTTLTDGSGAYRIDDVPAGVYVLSFEGEVYAGRVVAGVRVDAGSELRIDAELETGLSERITVQGSAVEGATALSRRILGRDDLELRPAALGDPFRALAGMAGIAPGNDFQSEMRVRGGDAAETAILLDGQPLPYAYHFGGGAGSAGTINGDLVDSLTVTTGGFSAEYGDALAGIIDVSTRVTPPGRTTGTAGVGSMLAHAAVLGPAGEGSYAVSGRYSNLGLYDGHVAGDATDGVRFHDLFGLLRLPLAAGARLEMALLEAGNTYEAELGYSARAAMSSENRGLRARLDLPLDPATLLRLQASDSGLAVTSGVTGGMSFDQDQRRQDLRVSMLRDLDGRHRLNGGLALERIAGGMAGTVSDGDTLLPSDLAARGEVASAFIEDTWRPADTLTLRYGGRADRSSPTGETALSPRFSLEIRPSTGFMARCAAGRFAQYPRQEQMFLAAGEPLRLQTADHVIAGFEVATRAGTRIVVEGYRKNLSRPIGEALNRYIELQERVTQFDRGTVRGAEITVQHQVAPAWNWEASYAWLRATQTKDGIESPRNTDQRHNLGLSFSRRLGKGWEAGAIARYASGLPYTPQRAWTNGIDFGTLLGDLNGARLPAYGRLDLRLGRSIQAAWGLLDVRLDLLNVSNRANVRSVDLSYDPSTGQFYRTTYYQSPFLPVLSLSAEF